MMFLFVCVILFMIRVKKTDAIVFVDDLTCNYREKVYADRFIKELDGTLLDKYLIDTSVVGKRSIEIQYKNRYGFVEQKRFEIEVKDVTAPTIIVSNPYTVEVGEINRLADYIFCADDYDDGIQCTISGTYDLTKVGKYNLSIQAIDKSGNQATESFTLNVVDKKDVPNKTDVTLFRQVYQKYKSDNTEIGLDISKWQGNVDFEKISNQGVTFVMLKLGGQSEIGGDIILDPNFVQNIESAVQHNLKVGVYFYSQARNVNEAKRQARWVIQEVSKYHISLPIAFDWENWDNYSAFKIGFRTLNHVASSFIDEINHYNYEGVLYSSKFYLENVWYEENYKKWLAYYTKQNDYNGDYFMWQVCNNGRIEGINGDVDIDILLKE